MRLVEIDAIKAIAIIGVMVAHMSFESRFDEDALRFVAGVQAVLGWCVLAFFFCSGMLAKPINNARDVGRYVRKRFLRLVVPCVVFSITYRVIRCGLFLTGRFSWESPVPGNVGEVLSFVLVPVGPQFYFLYELFAISVVVSLLDLLLPHKYMFLFSSILLVAFYGFVGMPGRAYGSELELIPLYAFSYLFGMASADKDSANSWAGKLFLLSVVVVMLATRSLVVAYVVVPYLLWLLFRHIPSLAMLIAKTRIGEYSSAIYVWHAPIIMPLISIMCVRFFGHGPLVLIPIIGCTLLCCILLGGITLKYGILQLWRF